MEFLNNIWQTVAPYLAGVSIGGVFTAIIYGLLRGSFAKTINKINVDKIVENATNKSVDKIKEVSFKHSIQPLVNSELEKVTEKANDYIELEMNKIKSRYDNIIDVLSKLAAYFNNSTLISDSVKDELNIAIKKAKADNRNVESVVVEPVVEKETEVKKSKTER